MQCQHAPRVNRQRFFCLSDRLIENRSICLVPSLPRVGVCSKSDFVSAETVGSAPDRLRVLHSLDLRRDLGHDDSGYFFLYREDVFPHAVVALGPDLIAAQRVDQLAGHTNSIGGLADAAFQHIADTEFPADLMDVERLSLVEE